MDWDRVWDVFAGAAFVIACIALWSGVKSVRQHQWDELIEVLNENATVDKADRQVQRERLQAEAAMVQERIGTLTDLWWAQREKLEALEAELREAHRSAPSWPYLPTTAGDMPEVRKIERDGE